VTAAKYAGVVALAAMGLSVAMPHAVPAPSLAPAYASAPTIAGAFAALVAVMWAYDGWADLSDIAGEVRDPARTLPRALLASATRARSGSRACAARPPAATWRPPTPRSPRWAPAAAPSCRR